MRSTLNSLLIDDDADSSQLVPLTFLHTDDSNKFLATLQWCMQKDVGPSQLLNSLLYFYFMNNDSEESNKVRSDFYRLLEKEAESCPNLKSLRELAQQTIVISESGIRSGASALDNLIGGKADPEKTITTLDIDSFEKPRATAAFFVSQWSTYWELFGLDLLSALKVNLSSEAKVICDCLKKSIKTKQLKYSNLFTHLGTHPKNERNKLCQALAESYKDNDTFKDYLNLLAQQAFLLFLLPHMNLSSEQNESLERMYAKTDIISRFLKSGVFTGVLKLTKLCQVYLSSSKYLPENVKLEFKAAILEGFLSLKNLNTVDDEHFTWLDQEDDLLIIIRKCELSSLVEEQTKHHHQALAEASKEGFQELVDLWNTQNASLSLLKRISPRIRYNIYPFNMHELMAFYFEQQSLPQNNWRTVVEQHYHFIDKEAQQGYWHKALTAAYAQTRNDEFRAVIGEILDEESKASQTIWWSDPAWNEQTLTDKIVLSNNSSALKDLATRMEAKNEALVFGDKPPLSG